MTNDSEKRTWEGRARPSMGSIGLCASCGVKDTSGIQISVVETGRSRARYDLITELCFDCASVVTDGLVTLLSHKRKDAVQQAMLAVYALREAVVDADARVRLAEDYMEQARQFEVQVPNKLPLIDGIDRARDALDALLLRSDLLPIASAVGNELEVALEHVMDARRIVAPPSEDE